MNSRTGSSESLSNTIHLFCVIVFAVEYVCCLSLPESRIPTNPPLHHKSWYLQGALTGCGTWNSALLSYIFFSNLWWPAVHEHHINLSMFSNSTAVHSWVLSRRSQLNPLCSWPRRLIGKNRFEIWAALLQVCSTVSSLLYTCETDNIRLNTSGADTLWTFCAC